MPSKEEVSELFEMFGDEPLHPDLVPYVYDSESFGKNLHHPLVIHIMYTEQLNKYINAQYKQKTKSVAEAREQGKWSRFIFLHERPYRIDALETVLYEEGVEDDPKVAWPLIANAWIDSENIYQNLETWETIWNLSLPWRHRYAMDAAERKALKALPDIIPIYRGTAHSASVQGMSWTTDKEKAVWFARRFARAEDREPWLVAGTVHKEDVFAHFLGRGESEIVVDPAMVETTSIKKIGKKR